MDTDPFAEPFVLGAENEKLGVMAVGADDEGAGGVACACDPFEPLLKPEKLAKGLGREPSPAVLPAAFAAGGVEKLKLVVDGGAGEAAGMPKLNEDADASVLGAGLTPPAAFLLGMPLIL